MRPAPSAPSSGLPASRSVRSLPARMKKMDSLNLKRFQNYAEQVTEIVLPFTFDSMNEKPQDLEKICDEGLGPDMHAQCMSAKFVDSAGVPILFYFGDRILLPQGTPRVSNLLQIKDKPRIDARP